MRQVLFRLLKEFWIPAVIAVAWTIYNYIHRSNEWALKEIINVFGPSFFLASWAVAQWFRIRKQVLIDSNFAGIEGRLMDLVGNLEKHTEEFRGYATGGDSVAYFMPMLPGDNTLQLGFHNPSEYPVFDVYAELIDLDEPIDPADGRFWTRHMFTCQSLYPSKMVRSAYKFDMSNREKLNANIFIHTRTQGLIQQLRVVKVEGKILIANKTAHGEKVLEKTVPDGFPGYDPEKEGEFFN